MAEALDWLRGVRNGYDEEKEENVYWKERFSDSLVEIYCDLAGGGLQVYFLKSSRHCSFNRIRRAEAGPVRQEHNAINIGK